MKATKVILILFSIILILTAGCSDEGSKYPSTRGFASGTTNSSGEVQLDMGSHIITVKTITESGSAASGIEVSGYLLENYFLVFASGSSSYYPTFASINYDSLTSSDDIAYLPRSASPQSPQQASTVEVDYELTLVSVDRDIYSFYDESTDESMYADDWITKTMQLGTLEDVYNLADSIDFEGGVFFHISDNVASQTNAEVQTVSLILSRIADFATFAVLLGLEFHIFEDDTLNINIVSYDENTLPIINIDGIILSEGSFFSQFTLTWGENPGDLDSHLWTPLIGDSIYHIYYPLDHRGDISSAPYAFLDVDDITSWGPEHIVIYQGFPGTYIYAVHHYSGSSDIPNSEAEVSVLKPDRTVEKFSPPSGTAESGWYWYVCDIDGTTGALTPVNTLSSGAPGTSSFTRELPEKSQ